MWSAVSVFALPLISLLAGIASLYIDPQKEPKKKWILIALMLLSAAGAVTGSISDDRSKQHSETVMLNQSKAITDLSSKADNILARLGGLGLDPSTANVIRQSISADTARTAILPSVVSKAASSNVTVNYYPKQVDGPVVLNALKEGGFKVETPPGNPANANLPTNSIWVGDSVSVDQAKFVALTLVRAGVGIVSVRRGFHKNPAAKKNLIEVGTDQALIHNPPLTVDQINAMQDIPPQTPGTPDLAT